MHVIAAFLMSLLVLAWAPGASLAEDAAAAGGTQLAQAHSMQPVPAETQPDLTLQQVVIGTAVLGGAFAVGLVAGGSLSTGIAAASAIVLVYTFMP